MWLRSRACASVGVPGGRSAGAIDRFFPGAVVDFLNVSCCGISNPFAFNVADIFIFFGALGLVIFSGKQNESD